MKYKNCTQNIIHQPVQIWSISALLLTYRPYVIASWLHDTNNVRHLPNNVCKQRQTVAPVHSKFKSIIETTPSLPPENTTIQSPTFYSAFILLKFLYSDALVQSEYFTAQCLGLYCAIAIVLWKPPFTFSRHEKLFEKQRQVFFLYDSSALFVWAHERCYRAGGWRLL